MNTRWSHIILWFIHLLFGFPAAKPNEPEIKLKYPKDCGITPSYSLNRIMGGEIIPPDEYSWTASLQYGNESTYGLCGGSVINSQYVLTAAHCVKGERVDALGGLTGLRLGDFSQEPYCDYGTSNCSSYQHFKVVDIIVHENYTKDSNHILHNDIALLRLDRALMFDDKLTPICLPSNMPELQVGTTLTVSGWGKSMKMNRVIAKRAVTLYLWSQELCEYDDESIMCAGSNGRGSCDGDSGGPLMYRVYASQMVLEGIVSQGRSNCGSKFFPAAFTNVRKFLQWIDDKISD